MKRICLIVIAVLALGTSTAQACEHGGDPMNVWSPGHMQLAVSLQNGTTESWLDATQTIKISTWGPGISPGSDIEMVTVPYASNGGTVTIQHFGMKPGVYTQQVSELLTATTVTIYSESCPSSGSTVVN